MENALFWFLLNMATIVVLAFYSMEEMAFVSFNKVRLQFYVTQGNQRAIWINQLLQNPSKLFTTTLIGVNVATFVGSECARKFHETIGLSPDLAPLSQVVLVIVFGELAPMFAARKYSEHVALLGAPIIYFSSLILAPMIWLLGFTAKAANKIFGGEETTASLFLTQDELQKILEEQDEETTLYPESREFKAITSNIFRLKGKFAHQIMSPLSDGLVASDQLTVGQLRKSPIDTKFLIAYQENLSNVIGIIYIRDLLRASEGKKLRSFCRPPWFISASTPLLEILKQFRRHSESIGIVLDAKGKAIGHICFEDILDEIFGEAEGAIRSQTRGMIIDQTFDGKTTLEQLKMETGIELEGKSDETLSDWFIRVVEHHPEAGESYSVPPYELIVKETSLLGISSLEVKARIS